MDVPEITDEQLASEYDDLAYKALANSDISEGLANEIARVSKTTAAGLRKGWQGPGPGRTSNADKGLPTRTALLQLRVTPEVAEWIAANGGPEFHWRLLNEARAATD